MLEVCCVDELCGVRCKVEMLILINGKQVSLHPELPVAGACGPSNKIDTLSEIREHLESTVLPSSFFKGLNSIIVRYNVSVNPTVESVY